MTKHWHVFKFNDDFVVSGMRKKRNAVVVRQNCLIVKHVDSHLNVKLKQKKHASKF